MTVEIVEVLRRSEQGITRPFICRGDNDEIYFVKGVGAGRRSQICEWIAGKLAVLLGLPIAPFDIVHVPEELLEIDVGFRLNELGTGPAFGSLEQRVTELAFSNLLEIPNDLQQDVFIFDWWIRNGDRILGENGGNPNLLWSPGDQKLILIDHNQAFDTILAREDLLQFHVFRGQCQQLTGDFFRRDEYNKRFSQTLAHWPEILRKIPKAWWHADAEMTVPIDFDPDWAYELLKGYEKDDFWK